jgi:hypothetical protein
MMFLYRGRRPYYEGRDEAAQIWPMNSQFIQAKVDKKETQKEEQSK